MYKIPLSVTPINHASLAKTLATYEGQPAMQMVDDFERDLRRYTGARYALALNSGTAAIHLALKALGVGPGDTVRAPTFTYVATINPIIYLGATPVLIDSEPTTWNMCPELLESAILESIGKRKKPKCLIVVHAYGMPARMKELTEISHKYDIPILEDAAEAIGSTYQGQMAGTIGQVGIFSFNNNKILTTYGGGALITQDKVIYEKALFWANQARENKPFYEHRDIGFNYRMGPLNAAAGLIGMADIENKISERRTIYERYRACITELNLGEEWWEEPPGLSSNRWLSTVLLNPLKINQIAKSMEGSSIECRRLWNPMHLQPIYQNYPAYVSGISEKLFLGGLSLPSCNLDAVAQVFNVFSQNR